MVGNRQTLQVERQIQELSVQVQDYTLLVLAYVLDIAGADLILGASWLAKLGPHVVDYDKKVIQFYHNNQFIVLKGDQLKKLAYEAINQLTRLCSTHAVRECYLLQLYSDTYHNTTVTQKSRSLSTEIISTLPSSTPQELVALLLEYQMGFSTLEDCHLLEPVITKYHSY